MAMKAMDYPVWMLNIVFTAMSPLGRLSLALAVCGLCLTALTDGGTMIFDIPIYGLVAALFLGALAYMGMAYFAEYEDRRKHATDDTPQFARFNPGFYLAIFLGAALATLGGLMSSYVAGLFTDAALTNWPAYGAAAFIGLIAGFILDVIFVSKVANGTWDKHLNDLRDKAGQAIEGVVQELDPASVAEILTMVGRPEMTSQVLKAIQDKSKK